VLTVAAVVARGEVARATPNPRCAGTCADGTTACGSVNDCGGATCVFPDACLPGMAGLIEAVLPETGVDDPAAWSCGLLRCRAVDGALAFASTFGRDVVAVKDLVVEPGRRYLVRGRMRADADTFGWLDVSGLGVAARAPDVVGPLDWTWLSAMFDVPAGGGAARLQLRLHAEGPGELGVRDLVVYVLGEHGVWLRFELLAPRRAVAYELGPVLRHVTTPPGARPVVCAEGPPAPADPGCIPRALARVEAEAGAPSPWIEVSALFAGGARATHGWRLVDPTSGAALPDDVEVRAEVAWRPEEAAVLWTDAIAPGRPMVALHLPEGVPAPDRIGADVGWLGDGIAADRAAFEPASARPSRLVVAAMVKSLDEFAAWPARAADLLGLLADLGLDAAAYLTSAPRPEDRVAAATLGLVHRVLDAEALLWPPDEAPRDLDRAASAAAVTARAGTAPWVDELAAIAAAEDGDTLLVGGAARGVPLSGPAYAAELHAWLEATASAEGLTPADLGVTRWDEVTPLEGLTAESLAALRPDPHDAEAARRFVWALRFWSVASAELWGATVAALADAAGADVHATLNAGSPLSPGPTGLASGLELQTLAGQRGGRAMLAELDLGGADDCRAWDVGWFADWLAGQAEPWREPGFIVGARLDAQHGDQGRELLELATRGVGWFEHVAYGPYDLSTTPAGGGLGAASGPWLERVARASELLARAEPWIVGATRSPPAIALLASRSDPVWTDTAAGSDDELGWHMALSQAGYAVDVMPESEIEAGRLEGPGAAKRLLLVLRKHVSRAAFVAIRRWVEDGGTLVLGPDLAAYDEYGQLDIERATWLGVAPGPARDDEVDVQWVTGDGLTSFSVPGPWSELVGIGATTIAIADDERPVALRVPRGRGRVFALGLPIGAAYRRPVLACRARPAGVAPAFPEQLSGAIRSAMTSIPVDLDLDQARAVAADDPRLSLQRLTGPAGPVVVAVAWSAEPLDVALSSPAWRGCDTVHEAIDDYDVPVIFGSLLMRIERAAVLTWDPDACDAPAVADDPDDDAREDTTPRRVDDGCAGGAPPRLLLPLALALAALARRGASRTRRRVTR